VGVNVTLMACVIWDTRSCYINNTEVYIFLMDLNFVWLDDLIAVSVKIPVFVYESTLCHMPEDGNMQFTFCF
jgi:hypothetical protein